MFFFMPRSYTISHIAFTKSVNSIYFNDAFQNKLKGLRYEQSMSRRGTAGTIPVKNPTLDI
jgi:hypothetical protein